MDSTWDASDDSLSVEVIDSSRTASPNPSSDHTSSSTPSVQEETRVRRKPIPKKGHTKSRRGCLSCKRRKVKCQEDLPECSNCKRLGLRCVYPGFRPAAASAELTPVPAAPLRTAPATFTMEDLRYFHHFLATAYPPLPMQGDAVWKGVAALSHQYDYLVHSMLGLAASHLDLYTGNDAGNALTHRVKAIAALNESLNHPCASTAEGDARFGAIMALTFQASCMPEGMTEFLSMVRGCQVIATTGMLDFSKSLFQEFTEEGYSESIQRLIGRGGLALKDYQTRYFDEFFVSLRKLAPLCTSPLEIKVLAAAERVSKKVRMSAVDAFTECSQMYHMITSSTNAEFAPFLDPTNYPAQLLLIHFFFIEFAIGELCLGSLGERFGFKRRATLAWLNTLLDALPEEYRIYASWPIKYSGVLAAGLGSPFSLNHIDPDMPQFLAPRPVLSLT